MEFFHKGSDPPPPLSSEVMEYEWNMEEFTCTLHHLLPGYYENFVNICTKTHKNHVLVPIVGKDLELKLFLGFNLGVIEGLINRGFF